MNRPPVALVSRRTFTCMSWVLGATQVIMFRSYLLTPSTNQCTRTVPCTVRTVCSGSMMKYNLEYHTATVQQHSIHDGSTTKDLFFCFEEDWRRLGCRAMLMCYQYMHTPYPRLVGVYLHSQSLVFGQSRNRVRILAYVQYNTDCREPPKLTYVRVRPTL